MTKNLNLYKTFNIHEATPQNLYELLNEEFNFNFDPCPLFSKDQINGLDVQWKEYCYINPPYGKAIRG